MSVAGSWIVGRDTEMKAVDAFLTTARTHYAVLTLEGEAGIGKTTIWLEALRRGGTRGRESWRPAPTKQKRRCPTPRWRTCSMLYPTRRSISSLRLSVWRSLLPCSEPTPLPAGSMSAPCARRSFRC